MEVLLIWVILAVVVAVAASSRGRSGLGWFLISCILSPLIGLILVLVLPNLRQEDLLKKLAPRPTPRASLGGKASRVTVDRSEQPFGPDGVYAGAPYRVERDVTAMMSGGLVKFRSLEQFQAAIEGKTFRTETDNSAIELRYPMESGDVRYRVEKNGQVIAWSRDHGEQTFKNWRDFYDSTH
jgi:hypothetical protein